MLSYRTVLKKVAAGGPGHSGQPEVYSRVPSGQGFARALCSRPRPNISAHVGQSGEAGRSFLGLRDRQTDKQTETDGQTNRDRQRP
eukprot:7786705-Alexandrium_andersonii.AAC.1